MVNEPTSNDIDLETLLKTAGQSFTDAQRSLLPGLETPVQMMLSNAELELKVAVSADTNGKMLVRPISSAEITRGGIDAGMLSTLRINFVSSIGELKTEPVAVSSFDGTALGTIVPLLTGLTLERAAALLKSGGWQFEPHAATSEEIESTGKESHGQVLRQQPAAGQLVDKTKTTLHFWVDLGNIPIREIDGIGTKSEEKLSTIGIATVGEMSLAGSARLAAVLNISEARAQVLLDMAALMSRLAVLGFKDEVVELLVKGAGIRSIEQLAGANPADLYRICREVIASGKVKVPREFSFTADTVKGWIKTAKGYVSK